MVLHFRTGRCSFDVAGQAKRHAAVSRPAAERDRIHSSLATTRLSKRLSSGAASWLPELQKRAADRRGSFIDRGRARDVALPGLHGATCHAVVAGDDLSEVWRADGVFGLSAARVAPRAACKQPRPRTTMIALAAFNINGEKIKPAPGAERSVYAKPTPRSPLNRIHRHHRPASARRRQPHSSRPVRIAVSQPIEASHRSQHR